MFPSRKSQHLNQNRVPEAFGTYLLQQKTSEEAVKYWTGTTSVLGAMCALVEPPSSHPCSLRDLSGLLVRLSRGARKLGFSHF